MRKTLFVKPQLQRQHLVWTLGIVLLTSILGYLVMESILKSTLIPQSIFLSQWIHIQNGMRAGFAVILFIIAIAIGLENYFFFHKIVGPIYALEKGLKRISEGHLDDVVRVRDNDHLKDLVTLFEEMKAVLRQRILSHERTAALLNEELSQLLNDSSLKNINKVRERLQKIREQSEKKAA